MNSEPELPAGGLELAGCVADGEVQDWERRLHDTPDPADKRFVEALRLLADISVWHERLSGRHPAPAALAAGQRLGPYEIGAPLGAGGMSEVFRARHVRLQRDVAIKVLPGAAQLRSEARARLEREARAVAALSHRNIVGVHDFAEQDGCVYVVLELLEGETARQRLTRGRLAWRDAARLAAEAASGLQAAHERGLVHRDIKPENLFLTRTGEVKLLDFGLARPAPADEPKNPSGEFMTDSGTLLGTPTYMSPEQLRGQPAGPRSDLFALGCVLYELLAGQSPFARASSSDTIVAVLTEEPRPLHELAEVPAPLADLIESCLRKAPEQRPAQAEELRVALAALLASEPGNAALAPRPPRRRLLAGALALVALVAATLYVARRAPPPLTLAVLPFGSGAQSGEGLYLAEGLADGLTNRLSKLSGTRMVPRAVAAARARTGLDPRELGRALDASVVLVGKLSLREGLVVAQVELVDVRSGAQRWGESYKGAPSQILEIEQRVGHDIASELGLAPSSAEREGLGRRYTLSGEAYRLYLEGRYNWSNRKPSGLKRAIALFQDSVAEDPSFALAYSGLADAYGALSTYLPDDDPRVSRALARRAAERALALDSRLAEAHASMGHVIAGDRWDWPAAEAEFREALRLDPGYASAHHWLAVEFLMPAGRFAEARESLGRARELDPLALPIIEAIARISYLERQYGRAEHEWGELVAVEPAFVNAIWRLGQGRLAAGRLAEALETFARAEQVGGRLPKGRALVAYALARQGRSADAQAVVEELLRVRREHYLSPALLALAYTGLGRADAAFEWLQRGCAERGDWMEYVKVEPLLDPLRSDARFPDVLACVGLAPRDTR